MNTKRTREGLIADLDYLLTELDFVTQCAADGMASELDIEATESAIDDVLEDLGMTMVEALPYLKELEDRYNPNPF